MQVPTKFLEVVCPILRVFLLRNEVNGMEQNDNNNSPSPVRERGQAGLGRRGPQALQLSVGRMVDDRSSKTASSHLLVLGTSPQSLHSQPLQQHVQVVSKNQNQASFLHSCPGSIILLDSFIPLRLEGSALKKDKPYVGEDRSRVLSQEVVGGSQGQLMPSSAFQPCAGPQLQVTEECETEERASLEQTRSSRALKLERVDAKGNMTILHSPNCRCHHWGMCHQLLSTNMVDEEPKRVCISEHEKCPQMILWFTHEMRFVFL